MWFRKESVEPFRVSELTFVAGQDVAVETKLKTQLLVLLRSELTVRKAYLARVQYANSKDAQVALALKVSREAKRDKLAAKVGRVFRKMFRSDQCLDIIFLSDHQESQVATLCASSYESAERIRS